MEEKRHSFSSVRAITQGRLLRSQLWDTVEGVGIPWRALGYRGGLWDTVEGFPVIDELSQSVAISRTTLMWFSTKVGFLFLPVIVFELFTVQIYLLLSIKPLK